MMQPQLKEAVRLTGDSLSLSMVEAVSRFHAPVEIASQALERVQKGYERLQKQIASETTIYGVNTGFGPLKNVRISLDHALELQRNLLRSHACGVGTPLPTEYVRAAMFLCLHSLLKGYSGVPTRLPQQLADLLNQGVHPIIPCKGSLGASGDLAPLAHLGLVLIGEGHAEYQGEILPGKEALQRAGLHPIRLSPKCGLALVNGTHLHTGIAALLVLQAERLLKEADIAGAMGVEAMLGSARPFDERVHQLRPHLGQQVCASNLRRLLAESEVIPSHAHCGEVQDAYSLRCIPQVHGACRQAVTHAKQVVEIELNSVTDNPLIFEEEVLSAGNFHGEPLALALDYLALALAELANISERRIARLLDASLSRGLPAFLIAEPGLHSGLMILQYTAAALVSENKVLAHPASVDSIPTGANQEDHVSMAMIAALKAAQIMNNTRKVLAIELLTAAQALDFRLNRYPKAPPEASHLRAGKGVEAAYQLIRETVPFVSRDRSLTPDIEAVEHLLRSGQLLERVEQVVGALG